MSIDERWTKVAKVPVDKLKAIGFGALKGKSDINPQWRIKAMTETYGMCGVGWYHELLKNWTETAPNGAVMAFCLVAVYIKDKSEWSKPIIGMGGNEVVSIAKGELKQSDEGWKMAYTDALGTALKSLGVASEIYEGNFDGSKYQKLNQDATTGTKKEQPKTDVKEKSAEEIKKALDNKKKIFASIIIKEFEFGTTATKEIIGQTVKEFAEFAEITDKHDGWSDKIDIYLNDKEALRAVIKAFKNKEKQND